MERSFRISSARRTNDLADFPRGWQALNTQLQVGILHFWVVCWLEHWSFLASPNAFLVNGWIICMHKHIYPCVPCVLRALPSSSILLALTLPSSVFPFLWRGVQCRALPAIPLNARHRMPKYVDTNSSSWVNPLFPFVIVVCNACRTVMIPWPLTSVIGRYWLIWETAVIGVLLIWDVGAWQKHIYLHTRLPDFWINKPVFNRFTEPTVFYSTYKQSLRCSQTLHQPAQIFLLSPGERSNPALLPTLQIHQVRMLQTRVGVGRRSRVRDVGLSELACVVVFARQRSAISSSCLESFLTNTVWWRKTMH